MDDYTSASEEARRLRLRLDEEGSSGARIKVVGVGGGGSNAVNRMVQAGFEGVEFVVANTDRQALHANHATVKLQIGSKLTKGLGAGADPNVGRQAALEDTDKIIQALDGADMIFVTTGLGGGTWDLAIGQEADGGPGQEGVAIVADAVGFCLLAANRVTPAELGPHITGDEGRAVSVLVAATTLALD